MQSRCNDNSLQTPSNKVFTVRGFKIDGGSDMYEAIIVLQAN